MEPTNKTTRDYSALLEVIGLESAKQIAAVEDDIAQVNTLLNDAVAKLTIHFTQVHGVDDVTITSSQPKGCEDAHGASQINTITQHAAAALVALQFEDLVRQLNERSATRLNGLRHALDALTTNASGAPNDRAQQFKSRCDELCLKANQSIHQTHLECGNVELF